MSDSVKKWFEMQSDKEFEDILKEEIRLQKLRLKTLKQKLKDATT